MPRRGSRTCALLLGVLLAALLGAVHASIASADFATQCAAPDRTVAAGDLTITVAAGETVLVASGFTGGVDALPVGGTLCVGPGATLSAGYLNNAAGALVVAAGGAVTMPSVVVAAGFSLELEGSGTFQGLGVNGAADIHVAPGADLTIASDLSPAAGAFVNEGSFTVEGAMNFNAAVSFDNAGTLSVAGAATVSGSLTTSGQATFSAGVTVNSAGSLVNSCVVDAQGDLINDGTGSSNAGLVLVGGDFRNNGSWQQSHEGVTSAVGLVDDGSVGGFGSYRFSGTTSVQGSWVGASAADPIRVQTVAPGGQVFDVETGTIANVVRTTVDILEPACAASPAAWADVEASKTGPATVLEGGTVSYSITVRNTGAQDAVDVVVSDPVPTGLALDPASTTGTLTGGVLTWQLGTVSVGQVVTLGYAGTVSAPAGSTLVNVVRSTSSTPDPVLANNDGSADASQVSTAVLAAPPPPNQPPVADDLVRDTTTRVLVVGTVTASDPDAGQQLSFTQATAATHGQLVLSAGGGFAYVSDPDFAGVDTFDFQVCDNASPTPACDTGTVTLNIRPRATDDVAVTFSGVPVVVPVVSNDTAGAPLDPVVVTQPTNGSVVLDPATGEATYTPDPGFTGTDTFGYRICSPTEPTFCDAASVLVDVIPPNLPPTVDPLTLATSSGIPVTGTLVLADPDAGDTVTAHGGIPPRSGTASVTPDGSTTYRPLAVFAGRDYYGDIVCDDGVPLLCTTGLVTVEVRPLAVPDAATTAEGTAVDVDIDANDQGAVGPATVTVGPAHGTVTISGGTARYVPDAGFSGADAFDYTICAAIAPDLCATTTVTLTVTAIPPLPPAPGPEPAPGTDDVLAVTGAEAAPLLLLGSALVLGGAVLVLAVRRLRT
ncbi:Ig-like domain-containing protein [Cellulomonas sp. Root137]|uniref:Ig-like domain-containing protein n=1 Tax=Cellulomonas sp. Root137 TaxID=1736459 RepID=UPI000A547482|nr:Ig-like domain-containing protein [Cellulomonas sp. Root137]